MIWFLLLLLFFALIGRAYRNTFRAQINHVPIVLKPSQRVQIDSDRSSLRILHLSDLHMENISIPAERVIADVGEDELDLIAITGDLLDRERSIPKALRFVETIAQLRPKLGVYVVFGNHDYVLPACTLEKLKAGLEQLGCHVLCNQTVTVASSVGKLHIIGIDDYATRHSDIAKSYRHVSADGVRLVLTHDPNIVLKMKEFDYDYLLSGHFHGGQIHWPKPFHLRKMGALPKMNIVKGLHYRDGRPFYISEGLGQTGLNVRLRSRPEITIHTLTTHKRPAYYAERQHALHEAAPALALD